MEVEFKTAKLANEKGFELETKSVWLTKDSMVEPISGTHPYLLYGTYAEDCIIYPRPTQSELQTWLREERGVMVLVDFSRTFGYYYKIIRYGVIEKKYFGKYEEALEIGLQEALNN
jgi:hypothetical protein